MSTLTLSNIAKCYPNGYQAIQKLNLNICDGEMVVLVGPSGCGKSTLLRMIAGLEEISSGELKIDTTTVNDLEPGERDIAMVFQNYALYPHMTVYNNMAYGLRNRRTPKAEIERLVHEAAKMLELDHLLDRKPGQLSGGQRQRVAMGRAIVREPKVFLFDEPLSNLDAKLRVQMRLEIKKLQHRLGTTSVYVTHDQVEAMTLADKLVVLNKGNVEQVGTPLEIYDNPASLFVATFIGSPSMNILDGNVSVDGITIGDALLPVSTANLALGEIKLGLRPEHLQISQDTPWLQVEVELIESLGADLLLYCHTEGGDSQKLVVRVEGHTPIQIGDKLGLDIKPKHVHLFDANTEKRIESTLASAVSLQGISDETQAINPRVNKQGVVNA
ncbi:sn-glycerol 3-phosphate ABC transporter ATP binding subunit [Vibrio harveyi]|uniref:sn-glycerol-3-phosphate import ATP-binding protein UgpC n=1 Tax=Vibrio harveyi TaxID=669 RepID=UPI001EFD3771|nr:sn-glycerol-3-phosphate import ATP-binding protein UgpC [Vibrio harveyi]MCG9236461.1 sn-glycerol-3-phosphate import ATP-binding protein UgpC [Vibrio harveyi]MCG9588071.1 sn-glycerol-3-phosphate import ATP-binding protein UgpC [Vibrio harveyi]MCG9608442.1 sn-glycerol-3-phosphate import ATP-binding protein UgpC [Vibrio harveyi]MCG9666445.1 sn-glycerol-3-phosphate import ATP-binding protein UgpC [Vibrio harveyi]CAH1223992.1 sn-glycerol 3-phosphate ABC transporter ATP binding subunit [Vibrio ha